MAWRRQLLAHSRQVAGDLVRLVLDYANELQDILFQHPSAAAVECKSQLSESNAASRSGLLAAAVIREYLVGKTLMNRATACQILRFPNVFLHNAFCHISSHTNELEKRTPGGLSPPPLPFAYRSP